MNVHSMRNLYIIGCSSNKHGELMNVNLGAPYLAIIDRIIEKGYSASQTEAIRQALIVYDQKLEEEEVRLVNKGVEAEMAKLRAGKVKTYTHSEIKKMFGL